ncbi:MAG: tetratricopeptide repeat protein [Thermodesulfobacteriota bacterium]
MSGIRWEKDIETALEKAKAMRRPIFQDFWFDGCVGCAKMDLGPYSDPSVIDFINADFVPVRTFSDLDNPSDPVVRMAVKWTPTFFILDAEGKNHHWFVGYVPAEDLFAHLWLGKAKILYDAGRHAEAIPVFSTILDRYPDAGVAPEAAFLRGVSGYRSARDPKELRKAYDLLVERYPRSEWARRAEPYAAFPAA